jgi:hypothetical protein
VPPTTNPQPNRRVNRQLDLRIADLKQTAVGLDYGCRNPPADLQHAKLQRILRLARNAIDEEIGVVIAERAKDQRADRLRDLRIERLQQAAALADYWCRTPVTELHEYVHQDLREMRDGIDEEIDGLVAERAKVYR